jgi:hypothetical protein
VSADLLRTSLTRLDRQLAPWSAARYAVELPSGLTAGATVHALAQTLADLAAAAEGQPLRPVPRIGDPALRDQLTVLAHDLLAAAPDDEATLSVAAEAIRTTARTLDGH